MSIQFEAKFYSGQVSSVLDLIIKVDEAGHIEWPQDLPEELKFECHIGDTTISARVGNSMRYIELPNGGKLESRCNDKIDILKQRWQPSRDSLLHRLESNLKMVMFSVVFLIGGGYAFIVWGIPALSGPITATLPIALDNRLGAEALEQLDDIVFSPTTLDESRQLELQNLFSDLIPEDEHEFNLHFRQSKFLGANAFALPNGDVVFTDDIIALADDDQMLAAIMLHEMGHVVERHAMQNAVRQAGLSILLVVFTGDVNSAASLLIVGLPNLLIYSRYSRDLEWSADGYALREMLARDMDPEHFAGIMEKLGGVDKDDADADKSGFDYFSSHPATIDRIMRFRNAKKTLQP